MLTRNGAACTLGSPAGKSGYVDKDALVYCPGQLLVSCEGTVTLPVIFSSAASTLNGHVFMFVSLD